MKLAAAGESSQRRFLSCDNQVECVIWINLLSNSVLVSSADPKISSAELIVSLICLLSVNFFIKSLLFLQFLFDHSEFFTGETRQIVPPCNKAGISNFLLKFQEFQEFQISSKCYSSFSSYSIILNFLLEKLGI